MDYSFHPLADEEVDEIVGYYDGIEDTLQRSENWEFLPDQSS
jgi:hypothetical protein